MERSKIRQVGAERRPGRGATSNFAGRFEAYVTEDCDDGWEKQEEKPLRTHVSIESPRSIITRNTSPDLPFDRSINPYRGCEHGCIYCFARPTHAYLGYSPGLDFETRLISRPNAPERLASELARKAYSPAPIAIGTNTDPYQPIERQYRVMRGILTVLLAHRHPVTIVTKGTLIERDLDLLSEMAARNLVHVGVSLTTLDAKISRRMEPRVPAPARRLKSIEALARAGIPTRVMVAPIVPALTDHELESILSESQSAGAKAANYILLRLPGEVGPLFQDWLEEAFPDRANRVMSRMREMRGGENYRADFGRRMIGQGEFSRLLAHRFKVAIRRLGLLQDLPPLECTQFRVPPKAGDQLSLF
ncbi:PA0069 family radical SAM protein [Aliiroseovarius sp. KMU-50]|uniref:PA0069 family radical SAM protein n=1 Tax=Aliiroseovarius salicola TaxID=3009082 RepID=A0ABT4W355_9RHOB|nr:PA0069 family radical SAM protein [Aliiroseovarius sp. KMU-50]MDA5094950.1 PA0069 family radical SAM protein [Aliiroseovarius sp. KMU-50]